VATILEHLDHVESSLNLRAPAIEPEELEAVFA